MGGDVGLLVTGAGGALGGVGALLGDPDGALEGASEGLAVGCAVVGGVVGGVVGADGVREGLVRRAWRRDWHRWTVSRSRRSNPRLVLCVSECECGMAWAWMCVSLLSVVCCGVPVAVSPVGSRFCGV